MARWQLIVRVGSGISMMGTFTRVLLVYKLPHVFFLLPVSLCLLPAVLRYTPGLQDDNSKGTISGVLTGATAGFLSAVEKIYKNQWRMLGYVEYKEELIPYYLEFLQGLELLQLPLLIFTVIHSFDRIFYRWPSNTSLIMAAMTAFFADLTIVFCLVVFHSVDKSMSDMFSIFILIYGLLLMLSLLPLFREAQRCWLILIILFSLIIYWELIFFGIATWDWLRNSYPVPGALTGIIYIFHNPALDETCKVPRQYDIVYGTGDCKQEKERVDTSIMWHVGAQLTERIALYKMFRKSSGDSDCFSACFSLAVLLYVFSPMHKGSRTQMVIFSIAILLFYITDSLSGNYLHNSHHIDVLLGLTFVYFSVPMESSGRLPKTYLPKNIHD